MMRSGQDTNILHSRQLPVRQQRKAICMYPCFIALFLQHGYVGGISLSMSCLTVSGPETEAKDVIQKNTDK